MNRGNTATKNNNALGLSTLVPKPIHHNRIGRLTGRSGAGSTPSGVTPPGRRRHTNAAPNTTRYPAESHLTTANADDYAVTVINLLGTMRPDDPKRTDGLLRIRHWIDKALAGETAGTAATA